MERKEKHEEAPVIAQVEMSREMLLMWLDDPVVQARIRKIVADATRQEGQLAGCAPGLEAVSAAGAKDNGPQSRILELERENGRLREQLSQMAQREEAMTRMRASLVEKDEMIKSLKELAKKIESSFHKEQDKAQGLEQELGRVRQHARELEAQMEREARREEDARQQIARLEQRLRELEAKLAPFRSLMEAHACLQRLAPATRASLRGIFPGDELTLFIVAGLQQTNLESLHDYIRNEIIEGRNPDRQALTALFGHLLDLFLQGMARYEIEAPKGREFDPTRHAKTPRSAPSGRIRSVLLPGWRVRVSGKPVRPALVEI